MDPFESTVFAHIRKQRLLESGGTVVVSLSGGPDSTALLKALLALSPALGVRVHAFHLNHRLRPEADLDEAFVRALCRRCEVPIQVEGRDVGAEAEREGLNLEDASRRARYRLLFRYAARVDARAATGHTQDDQAETVLLKLIRGAGTAGLSGIRPLRKFGGEGGGIVVRPLLKSRRRDVVDYLTRQDQAFRVDKSNEDLERDRNWIRHRLLPLLEERMNPSLTATLARSARVFSRIDDFLGREAKEAARRAARTSGEDLMLSIPVLVDLHPALRREVIRRAIGRRFGSGALSFDKVESVFELIGATPGRELHLARNARVLREFDALRLTCSPAIPEFRYEIEAPGSVAVPEVNKEMTLSMEMTEDGASMRLRLSGGSLRVRNRRAGDRFRTHPGGPRPKLKKLLSEKRIPRLERDRLLVLEDDGVVVWVEGFSPLPDRRCEKQEEGCFEIRLGGATSIPELDSNRKGS